MTPNCAPAIECHYAVAGWAGCVALNLNPRLSPDELAYCLEGADCEVLVADTSYAGLVREALKRYEKVRAVVWTDVLQKAAADLDVPTFLYETIVADGPVVERPEDAKALPGSAGAEMYYTSGTSGRPKGVVLSRKTVLLHALGCMVEHRLKRDDVWLHCAPMFHLVDAYAATWASLGIDGALLSDDDLTEADLEELSVAISIHRRRVLAAVARLKSQGVPEELLAPTPPATPEPASPPRRAAPKKSPARSPARSAPSPPPPKKRAADGRQTARELHATAGRRASAAPEPPQPKRRAFTDLGVNGRDAEIEAAKRRAAARKSGAKSAPRPAPRKPAAIPARPKEPPAPDDGFFDDGDFEAPTGDEDVADLFG